MRYTGSGSISLSTRLYHQIMSSGSSHLQSNSFLQVYCSLASFASKNLHDGCSRGITERKVSETSVGLGNLMPITSTFKRRYIKLIVPLSIKGPLWVWGSGSHSRLYSHRRRSCTDFCLADPSSCGKMQPESTLSVSSTENTPLSSLT